MVLPYMVTWIPSIYPLYVSIYSSTMDPSWALNQSEFVTNHPRLNSAGQLWGLLAGSCTLDALGKPLGALSMPWSYWKWSLIVDFPMKNGGSFHSYLYVYQRVMFFLGHGWHVPSGYVKIAMERSTMLLMGKSTISMAMFNSYVSLPEGKWCCVGGWGVLLVWSSIISFQKNSASICYKWIQMWIRT